MLRQAAILSASFLFALGCAKNEKPNVILFVVDDLGWTDLTCYGSDLYQTPNIDKLASQGIRFTDGYAACTVCSPSRASIMTGKYPAKLHCTDWISGHQKPFAKLNIPDWTQFLSEEEITLAEVMKQSGYNTYHIGKWHLGETENYWPENQGFDKNIGGWSVGAPQRNGSGNGYFPPYLNPRLADGPEGEYLTERLTKEALTLIDSQKDQSKPFFLNFWFYNVHTPLQAKKEKIKKYEMLVRQGANHINPVYAAMIEHVDEAVGAVFNKLDSMGILHNTIIIFTSDNGGLCGNYENNRRRVTSNFPLRSGKGDIYEGGVRVPFIMMWNKKIKAGQIEKTPVISADIYPTILGLTQVQGDIEQNKTMDGKDLSKLLTSDIPIDRKALYWHYPHYHLEGARPYSAIRKGDWKLIQVFEEDEPLLFNLKDDIGENNNLAAQMPERASDLLSDLNEWRAKVGAQIPLPNQLYNEQFEEKWKAGEWRNKSNEEFLEHLKETNAELK